MKKSLFARAAVLVFMLSVLLTASGCVDLPVPPDKRDEAEIWCIGNDPFAPELVELAESFNNTAEAENCRIAVVSFESEELLAQALEESRPALLLCDQLIARSLNERELLESPVISSSSFDFADFTKTADNSVGNTFFPIGAAVQLFVYNNRLNEQNTADFKTFCAQAGKSKSVFFGVDDFSRLLSDLLLSNGEKLGEEKENLKSVLYVELYNSVAELAFSGALYLGEEEPIKLLEEGKLAAAYAFSDRIALVDQTELHVSLPPALDNGSRLCVARVSGLAYTNENIEHGQVAVDFIKWLFCDGKTASAAIRVGLLPTVEWMLGDDTSELERALFSVRESCDILAEANSGELAEKTEEYEANIRQALAILAS